jgi:DNA-directed RNA polymerase I, II, and III subunit RPABC2
MDEFAHEDDAQEVDDDALLAEAEVPETGEGEIEETTEAQRAEAADLAKLLRQHPEIWIPYEEQVRSQLNVVPAEEKDEEGPVIAAGFRDIKGLDDKHVTYPFLNNYERTKVISYRASQICNGAKPYIVVPEGITEAHIIAKMELEAKKLPFIIKRPLPDGTFEVWRLGDLVVF